MEYKLTERDLQQILRAAHNVKNFEQLSAALSRDSRLLILFRLTANLDRKAFAVLLGKHIETIANLERGTIRLKTENKRQEYVRLLKRHFQLPIDHKIILGRYRRWLRKDQETRAFRAKTIAHLGGIATTSVLSKRARTARARKGGLEAKKRKRGIHKYTHKWMLWSKKGLKRAGRKTARGPRNEKMANKLEVMTAKTLLAAGADYRYEPLLKIGVDKFYPDFVVGNCIIECCHWESIERWKYLSFKLNLLKKNGFRCFVVTKRRCNKLAKILPRTITLIFEDELNKLGIRLLPNGCQPPR